MIKELIEILPQVIIYIVVGYTFVKIFHLVSLKQNSTNVEHILITSLVIGYIYCNIAYLIPSPLSYEVDIILIVLSAAILGYFLGRILRSKGIALFLDFLKIRDTGNLYLWDDLMDNNYPMKIIIDYKNVVYEGLLHNYETYSNEPHVVLGAYTIKNIKGKVLKDASNNNTEIVILNISNAKSVNIIYNKHSMKCEDLKNLCESIKEYNNDNKE